jgi:hypothetical protein
LSKWDSIAERRFVENGKGEGREERGERRGLGTEVPSPFAGIAGH